MLNYLNGTNYFDELFVFACRVYNWRNIERSEYYELYVWMRTFVNDNDNANFHYNSATQT